ncbi:hypothetical protein WNY51_04830 [Pseudocolwellia sp. AS88]|uniref:hypothetical protein n=1 Tax=Pseudocolwellia sp. AS88 TaxID=3063958 RepID=UPI0026F0F33A|nr:hypothetical protein [Pseudocolwellia sp. AS88]
MFKIIAVYSTLVFILCLCLGCEKSKEIKEKVIEPKCISSQSNCFIKSASGDFSLLFNQEPVITETPFNISLISQTKNTIKNISAHMEGKNMFMGKVPLFFQQALVNTKEQKQHYIADTMLGSCSEEKMRWVIYFKITLEDPNGESLIEHFTVEFDSLRF